VPGGRGVFDVAVHVVVVGCGRVGALLAQELSRAGHSVAVIDKNEAAFRRLPRDWDGLAVVGAGFDRDRLEEAGIGRAAAFAAVTSGDNSNILCARIARETYQIRNVVARIYDPRRAEIYQRLGIPTVATVTWTADQVMRDLFPEHTAAEWSDPSGQVRLVPVILPLSWCGRRLSALEEATGGLIVMVARDGVPHLGAGDLVGQDGDVVHLALAETARHSLEEVLAGKPDEPRQGRGGR
jgi:trk system potassium uptake protein TrkA